MDIRQGVVVSKTNLVESKKEKASHWRAASFVIILSLILYGGGFALKEISKVQINKLKEELTQLEKGRNYKEIATVIDTENRLAQVQTALEDRIDWVNFYNKLELNTLPEVTFNSMTTEKKLAPGLGSTDVVDDNVRITLKGVTTGVKNITKQMNIFLGESRSKQEDAFAKSVQISGIDVKEGGHPGEQAIEFSLAITVEPEITKSNPFLEKNSQDKL